MCAITSTSFGNKDGSIYFPLTLCDTIKGSLYLLHNMTNVVFSVGFHLGMKMEHPHQRWSWNSSLAVFFGHHYTNLYRFNTTLLFHYRDLDRSKAKPNISSLYKRNGAKIWEINKITITHPTYIHASLFVFNRFCEGKVGL